MVVSSELSAEGLEVSNLMACGREREGRLPAPWWLHPSCPPGELESHVHSPGAAMTGNTSPSPYTGSIVWIGFALRIVLKARPSISLQMCCGSLGPGGLQARCRGSPSTEEFSPSQRLFLINSINPPVTAILHPQHFLLEQRHLERFCSWKLHPL